jgi:hypothetical protein
MHRLAIYQPEALLVQRPLSFVGFISGKQKHLRPCVAQAIQRADQKLVEELADAPGILSYTSLQLQNGNWCNLVLLSDASAKTYLKSSQTHNYAAYHLAHSYYEWIRLHQGVMPEGLDHRGMQLQKTKYYTFPAAQPRPLIRELLYQAPTRVQPIADSALRNDVPANPPL